MSVKLESLKDLDSSRVDGPIIRCDICGAALSQDKRPGVYVFKNWTDESRDVIFACKYKHNGCHDAAEAIINKKHGEYTSGWMDVSDYIKYLTNNYATGI